MSDATPEASGGHGSDWQVPLQGLDGVYETLGLLYERNPLQYRGLDSVLGAMATHLEELNTILSTMEQKEADGRIAVVLPDGREIDISRVQSPLKRRLFIDMGTRPEEEFDYEVLIKALSEPKLSRESTGKNIGFLCQDIISARTKEKSPMHAISQHLTIIRRPQYKGTGLVLHLEPGLPVEEHRPKKA